MPRSRAPLNRSPQAPAASRAFCNRERISCRPVGVATERAPRPGRIHPSVVLTFSASSHRPKPVLVPRCQASNVCRPRGFSPPRRFAPPKASGACCISLPTMGFTGLPCSGAHACDASFMFPRCQTLQSIPLRRQPPPRHHDCVPPHRLHPKIRGLEALIRREVRCVVNLFPGWDTRGSPGFP